MSNDKLQNGEYSIGTNGREQLPPLRAGIKQFAELPDEQIYREKAGLSDDFLVEYLSERIDEKIQGEQSQYLSNSAPIPEKVLKKSKRIKCTLIVVIILLLLMLCGGIAAGVYYYLNFVEAPAHHLVENPLIDVTEDTTDNRDVITTIEMLNLALMFGKTPNEIIAFLGPNYTITKIDADATAPAPSDSTEGNTASDTITYQVVTISYLPVNQSGAPDLRQTQKVYLSLGAAGTTIEVYFVSSMDILDYPLSSFADLVATNDSFVRLLSLAGVTIASDVTYSAPNQEEYTEYASSETTIRKIRKETTHWTGALVSEVAPMHFDITYTFDYGASGVEDTPGRQPSQRMLYIKLS